MGMEILLTLLIIADVLLFFVMVFVIVRVIRLTRGKSFAVDNSPVEELKTALRESEVATARFLETMEEKIGQLKGLMEVINEKERRLGGLINRLDDSMSRGTRGETTKVDYQEIISLVKQGLPCEEISKITGLTEGEVALIADLYRPSKPQPPLAEKLK